MNIGLSQTEAALFRWGKCVGGFVSVCGCGTANLLRFKMPGELAGELMKGVRGEVLGGC